LLTGDAVQLAMQLHFTHIHLHEIGFHAAALPQEEILSPQLKSRSWYYSTARSESLIRCLQASKDYIDRFLSLSAENLTRGTLPDIFGIIYAVLVLGTFAVRVDTPTLDAAQLREMANYNYYLNSLIAKTTTNMTVAGKCGANDYLFHLHTFLQQTRVWYAQLSADPSTMSIKFPDVVKPGFSFMDIINTIVNRCVDFAAATLMDSASSDEQGWTELLTEWSESLEPTTMSLGSLEQF
jgi:hypothetical protein